jgi:hypothetical protein
VLALDSSRLYLDLLIYRKSASWRRAAHLRSFHELLRV